MIDLPGRRTNSQFGLPSAAPFSLHISCQYQFYAPGAPGLQTQPIPSLVVFSRFCQPSAILHRCCTHCLSTPHFQYPRAQQQFSALVSRFPACTLVTFKSNSFFSAAKPGARPDLGNRKSRSNDSVSTWAQNRPTKNMKGQPSS